MQQLVVQHRTGTEINSSDWFGAGTHRWSPRASWDVCKELRWAELFKSPLPPCIEYIELHASLLASQQTVVGTIPCARRVRTHARRHRHRHRHRHTDTQTHRHTDTQTHRHRHRHRHTQTHTDTHTHTHGWSRARTRTRTRTRTRAPHGGRRCNQKIQLPCSHIFTNMSYSMFCVCHNMLKTCRTMCLINFVGVWGAPALNQKCS